MATKPAADATKPAPDQSKAPSPPRDPIQELRRRTRLESIATIVFIAVLSFIFLDDRYLRLNIGGNSSGVQVSSYWHKLELVLCYQSLAVFWLLFNLFYVISRRCKSGLLDPLAANNDARVVEANHIFHNSIEQFLLSVFAQIISISFIDKSILIKLIPLINILFIVGRISFFYGYPNRRTFGFLCSAIPTTLLIHYNLIKFLQSLFF